MDEKEIKFTVSEEIYDQLVEMVGYQNFRKKLNAEEKVDLEILVRGIILTFLKKIEQATETEEINVNYLKILASNTEYPLRNKLKQYLKNIGMKQAELAAITNIKKGNLSLIVNNHVQPSLEAFFKIWAALQYPPIEELFYRDKD